MWAFHSLVWRLSLLFALVSLVLLGGIGVYLFHSLSREIIWRDDQMLRGRLERMQAQLGDALPAPVFANMLGKRDSLLWVLDARGEVLIEVNPAQLPVPKLSASAGVHLENVGGARLAWQTLSQEGRS